MSCLKLKSLRYPGQNSTVESDNYINNYQKALLSSFTVRFRSKFLEFFREPGGRGPFLAKRSAKITSS